MATTLFRLLAVTAAIMGTAVTAGTAAAVPAVAEGDVDGDGVVDRISLVPAATEGWALRVDLATGPVSAPLADDERIPQAGLRVTDIDADGTDEVVAPVSVGANTTFYRVFLHHPDRGLVPLTGPDGQPFDLVEGGGVAAVSGYSCPTDHDGRTFDVVGATLVEGAAAGAEPRYEGHRTEFAVADGALTERHSTRFADAARTDPVLAADPATCAPA